ncbi:hypothetical protein ACVWZN_001913 [Lysobacter sp. HA35]
MSRGDVGQPYASTERAPLPARLVWVCIGVTVFVATAVFVLRVIRTVAAFHGASA